MNEERKKILEMISTGKITVDEAESLLNAIGEKEIPSLNTALSDSAPKTGKTSPRYLRVEVNSNKDGKGEKVNIKVPFQLLRAGVKMASLMPKGAQDKVNAALSVNGVDFDLGNKSADVEELINQLSDLTIDVDGQNEKVRIYCE